MSSSGSWACNRCTFINHSLVTRCDICEAPREAEAAISEHDTSDEETILMDQNEECIRADAFYSVYYGHNLTHLTKVLRLLRAQGKTCIIYLAGDSSMDNKHWLFSGPKVQTFLQDSVPAVNGMELVLQPGQSMPDVAHFVNEVCCETKQNTMACINTAVEESTIGERSSGRIFPQDRFIRDHLTADDIIVASLGGNDVALKPSIETQQNMFQLIMSSDAAISNGTAPGFAHFVQLFHQDLAAFLESLCVNAKPKLIIVCMLYYMDEQDSGSWADGVLNALGYTRNPSKLQLIIRSVYQHAISQIHIEGVQVESVRFYDEMDGKDPNDYSQRVEPSAQGGAKMARLIHAAITRAEGRVQEKGEQEQEKEE